MRTVAAESSEQEKGASQVHIWYLSTRPYPPRNIQTPSPRHRALNLAILSPLVLAADLLFLLGCEIVGNVKGLSDLLWRLALNHVGNGLAANVEKGLDIKVVRRLGITS